MKRQLAIALMMAACGGCGGGGGGGMNNPDAPKHHNDGPDHLIDAPMSGAKPTIYTIVLENHDYAEIVGSTNAPYINSLIAHGALFTNYKDSGTHPSLPNYLYMISGDTQYPGLVDIGPKQAPYFPADKPNLGTQLEAANISWRSYQESMATACNLSSQGSYAPKHDPFLYFKDQQTGPGNLCSNTNVDYAQFASDLASNHYRYM